MAHLTDGERRVRHRTRSFSSLEDEEVFESRGNHTITPAANLRRIRIERVEGSTSPRRRSKTQTMPSESHATLPSHKSSSSHRRRRKHQRDSEEKERRSRRKSAAKDESAEYVYGPLTDRPKSSRIVVKETRKLGRDGESSESDDEPVVRSPRERKSEEREKKIKVIYVTKESLKTSRHKGRTESSPELSRGARDTPKRSSTHRSRRLSVAELPRAPDLPPKRSASTRNLDIVPRATVKRSSTTTYSIPYSRGHVPMSSSASSKRPSFLGGFFAPQPVEPEKLVECLTCLSDDIPRSKSARLKCGHRMCHSCLKRIFRLSVKDPQHMPPKCCTADHISLQHVDRLFDNNFKKLWNTKFAEYSTKNRLYCPARKCGEWIRPANIHREDGRKYGKCARCKTKVCGLCNGKWHGSGECPKDEETNKLLEAAKQAGWQRCYSCRTMVELKEGCNHMTCRCTAEFCMICGLKWKTCNCPWFNYEAVEADRLNHMRVAENVEDEDPAAQQPRRLRRPRPITYHEELDDRQRQERLDERLARRLQRISLRDREANTEDDYQGGIGDIHGIGNGAGHFMNQDYVRAAQNVLTGNFDQATAAANYVMGVANARGVPPPGPNIGQRRMEDRYPAPPRVERPLSPPPLLRRHSAREQAYNAALNRPSERVVPRRTRTDYEAEAAVHAPAPRPEPRPAVLAGLSETGRARNRVSAWRNHVQPGVTPEEGMLSI